MKRRDFIKGLATFVAGTAIAPTLLAKERKDKNKSLENLVYNTKHMDLTDNSKYPVEINKLYGREYLFGQHNPSSNELDFSVCYAEKTREIGNLGTGERVIEFKEEYIPTKDCEKINIHYKKGKKITERNPTLISKSSVGENRFVVSGLIEDDGTEFELPAAKIKENVYLVFKALREEGKGNWIEDMQKEKVPLYFLKYGVLEKNKKGEFTGEIKRDENAGWIIDNENGNIAFFQKNGIYRPILKEKNLKAFGASTENNSKETPCTKTYVVKKGDSSWSIADKCYGTKGKDLDKLKELNPHEDLAKIKTGQNMNVPCDCGL